jgi:tetrapyrrole methylase family protein / MazG family protein
MRTIHIVGLGPGNYRDMTVGARELLRSPYPIYLRTEIHPVVVELRRQGVTFQTFDHIYDQAENFEQVYETIAESILQAGQIGDVVYAVPGHPLVAEQSVTNILAAAATRGLEVAIVPAVSFLDVLFSVLKIDPIHGLTVIDGLQLDKQQIDTTVPVVVTQVYNPMVAADVKLTLMDYYPDEYEIVVVRSAGIPEHEKVAWIPLFELDRLAWVDHLTSIYIPAGEPINKNRNYDLTSLVEVMETLRSPGGCPWDIEQTHPSLKRYIVEEVYEVLEAIDMHDMDKLCDELGDLLLQIVFHARIAEEIGDFTVQDVINGVTEKMLRRHPHVFGDGSADTSDEVMVNWEKIKHTEKAAQHRESRIDGVPVGLPALIRAFKLQTKAAKVGFDWERIEDVWEKVIEETQEFKVASENQDTDEMEGEMGDLLFAVVNVARFAGIEPETALHRTNNKFLKRFQVMEKILENKGKTMEKLSLEVLDTAWNEAKALEAAKNQ